MMSGQGREVLVVLPNDAEFLTEIQAYLKIEGFLRKNTSTQLAKYETIKENKRVEMRERNANVQRLYRELLQNGRVREHPQYGYRLSGCTVRKLHGVFHQAMDAAVRECLTARNPTDGVTLPRKKAAPKQILNDEQLDRFLKEIKKDEIWYDFFYTELTTGLRRGEICGLRWTDFQVGKGTLAIRRTVHQKPGGGLTAGEPKTGQGSRVITLPPSTAQLLAERKRRSVSQWIFHDPLRPEQPVHPGSAYRRMKELLTQAGLPSIRFHDLRHTFATHALASGVDAKTLSGILGHTKASFTLDTYTHVTGDMYGGKQKPENPGRD